MLTTTTDLIGSPVEDLDTPCLVLDLDILDANLNRMASFFAGRECQLRPHFKNHKCTTLALKQLQAGSAVGITCAKLGEAEVLVDAGIDDILIANQVVGRRKIARLIDLALKAKIRVAVDSQQHVELISAAAAEKGASVGLLIEIDIGMGRCGIRDSNQVLELARLIKNQPCTRFDGFQAYEGHTVGIPDRDERRQVATTSMQYALDVASELNRNGVEVAIVSGGSSSTYDATGILPGMKEVQAGTYATMDWSYRRWAAEFEVALTILARVISRPREGVGVVDFGVKGMGDEFGGPQFVGFPDADIPRSLSEEHCTVGNVPQWKVGDAVHAVPSHACTTCNLYRQFYVATDGVVIDVWPIDGAGRLA
ncbi:MAG TPA: DSD1 family PLP-dependent enzyme [Planctomycetaceae bacterium]|nr:DSD1 family PLP-dependent enzyme [Planctomycetaceae bacterium]